MRNAIARGANAFIASLGALARSAKIDQLSHRPRWSSDVRDAPLAPPPHALASLGA
jgi:hypothetical protein